MDGVVESVGIALLEVSAAAAANEEGIARENHGPVIQDKGDAAVGVAGGGPHFQVELPEVNLVAVVEEKVGLGACGGGDLALKARQFLFKKASAWVVDGWVICGWVVCGWVGFYRWCGPRGSGC